MHELAIMESLVSAAQEGAAGAQVRAIRLEVGVLSGVVPDALRFCFDVCTRGTCLEQARLEIAEIAGRGRCDRCGLELAIDSLAALCPCGAAGLQVLTGQELLLKHLELA
jgi:hydrogenase nickel incorporation protein HypA/HybF